MPKHLATHFIGVGGLIINNDQVLFVKLTYGGGQNYWLIPGGLVEKGETLEEAVIREIKEETNLDISPTGILGIRSMVRKSDGLTDVYTIFSCELDGEDQELIKQDSEIEDAQWFKIADLDKIEGLLSYTKIIIEKYLSMKEMKRDISLDKMAKNRIGVSKYEQYWVS